MEGYHPWRVTHNELLQMRLLDWAFDEKRANPHMLHDCEEVKGEDRDSVLQATRALEARGFVRLDERGPGSSGSTCYSQALSRSRGDDCNGPIPA